MFYSSGKTDIDRHAIQYFNLFPFLARHNELNFHVTNEPIMFIYSRSPYQQMAPNYSFLVHAE